MSEFTHNICEGCWIEREAVWATYDASDDIKAEKLVSIKRPYINLDGPVQECCFCGNMTIMGIRIHMDPDLADYCDHEKGKEDGIRLEAEQPGSEGLPTYPQRTGGSEEESR